MYIQAISIDIKTNVDKDELIEEFGLLMSFYRGSGQIQGLIESQYITNNTISCLPYTLEKNSLSKRFNNFYVNKYSKRVEKLCNSKLTFRTVGKTHESYKTPCQCKKPDFYILITNYASIESPLVCGNCHKSVPLYRLPVYYDYGYLPILRWQTNYISCDRLQMNCEVGERWALNQMQEISSQLSRQGREICEKIENLTSIPTFYYLYNYKKHKGDQLSRPCPSCNKKWGLKVPLHNSYNFNCDKCKLVSALSPNS